MRRFGTRFMVVRFGNGITGAIPQGTIAVTYKVGGGEAGAVETER